MANGNTISEIRSILSDKQKVSQGVVNRLSLALMAEIYEKQEAAAIEEKRNREALSARMETLEQRSIGFWAYNHPKAATVIMLALYSFAISDIRQPVMDWMGETVKELIKYL